MKKNILLLLSIVTLILLIFFLRVQVLKPDTSLKGNMVATSIYEYDLQLENNSLNGMFIDEGIVYYFLMDVLDEENGLYQYQVKKLDIKVNEVSKIADNTSSMYCEMQDKKIYCKDNSYYRVYDLEFKLIWEYLSEKAIMADFVPFKDIYIKVEDKNIYLLRNEEELYRRVDVDFNLYYDNYVSTSDNTYLIYFDDDGFYYIYDVNNKELINIEATQYFLYEKGIVFYNEESFYLYDLHDNKTIEYQNDTQDDYYYIGNAKEDSSVLYLYDIIDSKVIIENLEEKIRQELNVEKITKDNPIFYILFDDKYLCLTILQDNNNFYVVDLEEMNLPKINTSEYINKLEVDIQNKISDITNTYNIKIKVGEDAIIDFPDFSAQTFDNYEQILTSLNRIDTILQKYDRTFFEGFYDAGYNGLHLYLTGTLIPSDYTTQASNPAAYSLTYNGSYMIVIDLGQSNLEELLCHELLHNLEFKLNNDGIKVFADWKSLNPSNFYYNNSYTSSSLFNYTLKEDNKDNVYFIDYYSHTYETEDRARVFEQICACNQDSNIKKYPHLLLKGNYLKNEILKYYPSLSDTSLFRSIE